VISCFDDLIAAANHAIVALDSVTRRDGPKATLVAVNDARFAYTTLVDCRGVVRMTSAENAFLQEVLDGLRGVSGSSVSQPKRRFS